MSETDPLQDHQTEDPLNSEVIDKQFEHDVNEVSENEDEEHVKSGDEDNEEVQPLSTCVEDDLSINHESENEIQCQPIDRQEENDEIENDTLDEPNENETINLQDNDIIGKDKEEEINEIENVPLHDEPNVDIIRDVHTEVNIDDDENETNVEQEVRVFEFISLVLSSKEINC